MVLWGLWKGLLGLLFRRLYNQLPYSRLVLVYCIVFYQEPSSIFKYCIEYI